jgi:hypothetical protein
VLAYFDTFFVFAVVALALVGLVFLMKRSVAVVKRMINLIAVFESAGVPALRIGFTAAVAVFAAAGVFIWRRGHQFFDRDAEVEDDGPVARTIARKKSYSFGAA